MHGGRHQKRRPRAEVSDETRDGTIEHVVNHGLTMREADLRVQPNLDCSTQL
uniref:Uncharacterized protein n=1 Tax=Anguilla anguilla TaxID=7936 RepID=A0A0E9V9B7_ANGAN